MTELSSKAPGAQEATHANAAVWSGPETGFTMELQPLPRLLPAEVLVQVELATICGSDLHTISGDRPTPLPTVLGHEAVGTVKAVGGSAATADGRPVVPGQRVTWTIGTSCGSCRRCLRGVPQKCQSVRKYGHEAITDHWRFNGGFGTYCHLVEGTGLVPVPTELPAEVAAPANCATATVVCAARRAALTAGDTVVVIGCGMLGLTAVAYARDLGAEHVIACDVDDDRRDLALKFGATVACSPSTLDTAVRDFGSDIVFELSGNSRAVQSALDIVALDGRVALVGSVSPGPRVSFEPNTFVRNLSRVVGCHNYAVADLAEAVDFLMRTPKQGLFAGLVPDAHPLCDIGDAVTEARRGAAPRIALRMD
ncbi:alcohol dehydrogenase catalytic domain-containing protein [Streptomyces sp. RPA4-5]|uniref:zinc-binding dehydrogenase n=1 Tax=Streptomyces sp. RPA4-5 TaxID=2721245 RepID=UPI00143E56BF|nr:zinc-binding dehydrogenase [Streptomyces sp. RPA4-5]QIY53518.1 alcohol dehydrogenase catalytic domain-containing protein [Streptomyces sp. RPA4-5]